MAQLENIEAIEKRLWSAADQLRANSNYAANEYFTRDAIRVAIRDFLWDDQTGLPVDRYGEDEVLLKADDVYRHVYRAYPTVPSPYYNH